MRILLDNNVPRGLVRTLTGHTITEARERGWAAWENGDLLDAAGLAALDTWFALDFNPSRQDARLIPGMAGDFH